MQAKLILTDVDDTVLVFGASIRHYFETECGLAPKVDDCYELMKLYGLTLADTLELISRFHRSDWMSRLPADPTAAVVLPQLYERGYRFVAITACLCEEPVVAARRANLEAAFGFPWEEVNCLGLTRCKRAALEQYPASVWVEDLTTHATVGAEIGHQSFLLDKPYNHDDHPGNVTRVHDWHELATYLN